MKTVKKSIQITCIMEKEWMEEPVHFETGHINNWFYDFAKEVAKLAEEHGLSHRMYHDVLTEKQ